jgi:hypothetical protein
MPLVHNIAPGKNQTSAIGSSRRWPARLAGIRRLRRRFRLGKWAGRRASSPRVDPQPELGVGVHRRWCAAELGSVGRGDLVFGERRGGVLTDKRCIHLRSASVRTYTFFTTGFPRFLSIRGARGLQAFDLPLLTNYSNPI